MATKRALTIGINNYSILDPTGETNLRACVNDARSMYYLLKEKFGFSQQYHLEDFEASRDRILSAIRYLIRISETGDSICVYFSGHGARLRADLSQIDCDKYYEALVPASGAWITDKDLVNITDDLYPEAINFTMITDACHSGGLHAADAAIKCRTPIYDHSLIDTIVNFLSTLIPCGICVADTNQFNGNVSNVQANNGIIDLDPDPNKTLVAATKSTLLSACDFNESSWENYDINHGLFTKAILETVNENNMQISYHDLMSRLQTRVSELMGNLITPAFPMATQTPQLFGQRNRMTENFLEGYIHSPIEI